MSQKNLNVQSKTHKYLLNKLKDKKIFQIYKKFENEFRLREKFIVAVSGGADSLALSFLTKIYSIKKSLNCSYFIVDHKLRNNSSDEAKSVKKFLKKYNINLDILKWDGIKPYSNIQSLARVKRYNLLIKKAKKLNIKNILTGHHVDDLYENFFIRISRGSGLNGLVSFYGNTQTQKINIIRPLLNFEKKDLIYITRNVFKFYVNDPSNEDDKFKRTRIRKFIKNIEKEGLDKKKFLLTIKNLKYSNEAIKFYTEKNLNDNSFFFKQENRVILNKEFFQQSYEIIFRSLTEIIKYVGKKYYPPRGKKVDKIINDIINKNHHKIKLTLGNCLIYKVNHTIIVTKEQ